MNRLSERRYFKVKLYFKFDKLRLLSAPELSGRSLSSFKSSFKWRIHTIGHNGHHTLHRNNVRNGISKQSNYEVECVEVKLVYFREFSRPTRYIEAYTDQLLL